MKSIYCLSAFVLVASLNIASAQQAQKPKPPVGVPSDAKLFNGKWYRIYLEQLPWNRAKEKCATLGGQLAIVPDEPTWAFLKKLSPAALWLGGTDEQTEGVWKWVDGSAVTFTAWSERQPDNTHGNENYIVTYKQRWNDVPRSGSFGQYQAVGFICEWKGK